MTFDSNVTSYQEKWPGSGSAVYNAGTFSASNTTFLANAAVLGAVYNTDTGTATLTDSRFTGNMAASGSAIFQQSGGALRIERTVFFGNGPDPAGTLGTGAGGALHVTGGMVWVEQSTFSENQGRDYGAIVLHRHGTLNIQRSTITGSRSPGDALTCVDTTTVHVNDVTIVGNTGGLRASGGCTMTVSNSIVALNRAEPGAADCVFADSVSVTVTGANLDSDGSCRDFGLHADPQLGPLADNGFAAADDAAAALAEQSRIGCRWRGVCSYRPAWLAASARCLRYRRGRAPSR